MNLKPVLDAVPRVTMRVNPLAAYGVTLAIVLASFAILQGAVNAIQSDAIAAQKLTRSNLAFQLAICDDIRFIYNTQVADLTRRSVIERTAKLPAVEGALAKERSNALLKSASIYHEHLRAVCKPSEQQVERASMATAPAVATAPAREASH